MCSGRCIFEVYRVTGYHRSPADLIGHADALKLEDLKDDCSNKFDGPPRQPVESEFHSVLNATELVPDETNFVLPVRRPWK